MRFGSGLAFVYDETWAFIRRAWWLALIPSLPLAGFLVLADLGSPKVWERASFWCAVGLAAVLQAVLPYCLMRFIVLRHDLAAAVSVNRASARTYGPYLAAMVALDLFARGGTALGQPLAAIAIIAWLFLYPSLSLWSVTAPSGSTVIGPIRSVRMVLPHLLWAFAFLICVLVPLGLLQTVSNLALDRLLGSPGENSSYPVVVAVSDILFHAASDLLAIAAQFVVAHKAGMRVSEDRSLAAVFD